MSSFWEKVKCAWTIKERRTKAQKEIYDIGEETAWKTGGEVEEELIDLNAYLDKLSDLDDI